MCFHDNSPKISIRKILLHNWCKSNQQTQVLTKEKTFDTPMHMKERLLWMREWVDLLIAFSTHGTHMSKSNFIPQIVGEKLTHFQEKRTNQKEYIIPKFQKDYQGDFQSNTYSWV